MLENYPVWRGPAGDGITADERERIDEAVQSGAIATVAAAAASESEERARVAADEARTAAELQANRYPSIADGLENTYEGQYFTVISYDPGISAALYRHQFDGSATLVTQYPSAAAIDNIGRQMQTRDVDGDILVSFVDQQGRASALTARQSDGMFPDFVIQDIAARLPGNLAQPARLTDMSRISAWGASDLKRMDSALAAMAAELGADFFAGTNNGAFLDSIWAEQGSRPQVVMFPGDTIPASDAEQTVTSVNVEDRPAIRARRCTVEGSTVEVEARGNRVTRLGVIGGVSQPVPLGGAVRLISHPGIEWGGGVQIWSVGRNDLGVSSQDNSDEVIAATAAAWASLPTLDKRVLIVGHWLSTGTTAGSPFRERIGKVNSAYLAAYAERFVDVSAYLIGSQVWTDTGLSPTADDLAEQAAGNLPLSLSDGDGLHLSPEASTAVVQHVIKQRLLALGWYEEA